MTELEAIIRDEIAQQKAISFARFMEMALYHPRLGYYRRGAKLFGASGDFYTAAQLQPVFGQLVASYASQLAASLAKDREDFAILELGAGQGDLRESLADWSYLGFDWNGEPLPDSMVGLVIANEFFDALPVHLLRKNENDWNELGVTYDGSRLAFVTMPRLAGELREYAEKFGGEIPRDGLLEVNLEMKVWISRLGRLLRSGRVLVIDYGYSALELPRFPAGTLLTFKQHQTDSRVLLEPGMRDITAHLNFSAMREIAVGAGFQVATDVTLGAWILNVWDEVELGRRWTTADERWRLQWKQLLYGMGESFRVLVLEKRAQK